MVKEVAFGMYLDSGERSIHFRRVMSQRQQVENKTERFIYLDNEKNDQSILLSDTVSAGRTVACPEVALRISQYGAFITLGLMKDLFVPFREQKMKMQVGKYVVPCPLDDESYRILASSQVDHYLSEGPYRSGLGVDIDLA